MSEVVKKPSPEEVISSIEDFVFSLENQLDECLPNLTEKSIRLNLKKILHNFGWNCVGSGGFAHVYQSPCSKYALKINFYTQDSYPYFAQMAINMPINPYLPNVYWHVSPISFTKKNSNRIIKSVTLMENLEQIDYCGIIQDDELVDFIKNVESYTVSPKCHEIDGFLGDIARSFAEINQFIDFDFDFDLNLSLDWVDFTSENIMLRGDQLVIIDPIC